MLTPEEKDKINAEEIFRSETRKHYESRNKSKLWTFLNSGFGLWFLSSIVLGFVVWAYQRYTQYEIQRKYNEQLLAKVKYEIYMDAWEYVSAAEHSHNYGEYSAKFATNLQRPLARLQLFKDATVDELMWDLSYIPPKSNSDMAHGISNTIASIWRDDLEWMPTINEIKGPVKTWVDNDIKQKITYGISDPIKETGL